MSEKEKADPLDDLEWLNKMIKDLEEQIDSRTLPPHALEETVHDLEEFKARRDRVTGKSTKF